MEELRDMPQYQNHEAAQITSEYQLDNEIEHIESAELVLSDLDSEDLEQYVLDSPEEPQVSWPESNPDGTITEARYLQQCRWRLGNIGHALDVIKDTIDNESDAVEWLELKMAVAATKSIGDAYAIVEPMVAVLKAGWNFTARMNMDTSAYNSVANK